MRHRYPLGWTNPLHLYATPTTRWQRWGRAARRALWRAWDVACAAIPVLLLALGAALVVNPWGALALWCWWHVGNGGCRP